MIHDFRFVPKKEWLPVRNELEKLINSVQDEVRDYFTFSFTYVGSTHRNMITRDLKSNIGYDFDVNIHVNDDDEEFSAEEIKRILKNAFDKHVCAFGYDYCEDSTRVLTIKTKDIGWSRVLHSCDFCIVYDCDDGRQQYIHYDKNQQSYSWKYLPMPNKVLEEKAKWITHNGFKGELESVYLNKKNENEDINKKSRSLFAEAVSEVYKRNNR